MPPDRMLMTVLQAYQEPADPVKTDKIYGTTASLLTTLNNPLNLSLLTSQFLTARSIWEFPDGLRTCLRIISIYNTAAINVRRNELENAVLPRGQPIAGSGVRSDAWASAIAQGTDERSPRWKHVLVLAGVLMGMEADDRRSLSRGLRSTLEEAVTHAANLALETPDASGPFGMDAVVLALSWAFPLLSDSHKRQINSNALLPALMQAMTGAEGFQNGDFLPGIAADLATGENFHWAPNSPSAMRLGMLESRPLVQNMGNLSRLAVFAVENATVSDVVVHVQEQLQTFATGLLDRWKRCPLAALDTTAESVVLTPHTRDGPWAGLWQVFRKIMYTVVAILQPIMGRTLLDPRLRNDIIAPQVATRTLHTLRCLYFISSRRGAYAFQVYTFTYMTSLDILTRYPDACAAFLRATLPPARASPNPLAHQDEILTLYHLNAAEHMTLALPTDLCEALVITPASAYLGAPTAALRPSSALALELFEAAHSAILSAMACAQHAPLTAGLIPFYLDALMTSFPARISARQFRLAFRTIAQIVSPPFPIAASHPELAETLLELLRFRAESAGTLPLAPIAPKDSGPGAPQDGGDSEEEPLSEQSSLVLALLDALPFLPPPILEEWLTRAAVAMNSIANPILREVARKRYWEILVSGEMDVERAAIGVAWWGTKGGREMVMLGRGPGQGPAQDEFMMSGALVQNATSRI